MTDNGGRKRFILLLAGFFLVAGLSFGGYKLYKYKYSANEVGGIPTAPTEVTAVDNADKTAITLSWQDVAGSNAVDYKIERSASIWHAFTEIASQSSSQNKTYTDTGVNFTTGQRYYYRIRGYNATGTVYSVYSKIATPTRVEYKDYLAGIGEMETSFTTYQQTELVTNTVDNTNTPDNRVASTWMGWHDSALVPQDDYYYRIEENTGVAGTNQQCFAVKKNNKTSSLIILRFTLQSGSNINSKEFSNGDKIKVVLDKLSYKSADGLPVGVIRNFSYYLRMNDVDVPEASPPDFSGTETTLPKSLNNEYTIQIPGNPTKTVTQFEISLAINVTNSNLLRVGDTPGICLDGAHFYIQKAGQDYTTVEVPARGEHIQNNSPSYALSNTDDPYYIASNYDRDSLGYGMDYLRLPVKYYNPNMKFYMYTARSLTDYRTAIDVDNANATTNSEKKFVWLLANHPEWFYTYDSSKLEPPSGDNRDEKGRYPFRKLKPDGTSLDYVFADDYQTEYLNKILDQNYINWWGTETEKLAKKRGFEGVFIDVSADRKVDYVKKNTSYVCPLEYPETTVSIDGVNKPGCTVYNATVTQSREVLKQFIQYLNDQGLQVIMNCSMCHFGQESGDKFFDPNNTAIGNTADNTPDSIFQELAFVTAYRTNGLFNINAYRDIAEWNRTVADMERYEAINRNLPESQKKAYEVSAYGFNKTVPDPSGANPKPADPLNKKPTQAELNASLDNYDSGWASHVIASYLMGSNKYTYLSIVYDDLIDGVTARKEYPLNDDMLDKLGQAADKRRVQYGGEAYDWENPVLDSISKKAVNFRTFEHGLVADNANPDLANPFVMPGNYVDEYGRKYPAGTTITLQKRTGRIFFKADKLDKPSISVVRTQTYSDKTSVSGTADLFATSVTVNGQAANLNTTNHTWTFPSFLLNMGANNITVITSDSGVASDPETVSVNRRKIGDANGDNKSIDRFDLSALMINWNKFEFANPADFNEDGSVGNVDFSMMMLNWGK